MATPATKSVATLTAVTPVAADSVLITDASDSDDIKRSLISLLGAAMGLGSLSEQDADDVAITAGSISGVTATNLTISGGTINDTPVGASVRRAGNFTAVAVTNDITAGGTVTATNFVGDGSALVNVGAEIALLVSGADAYYSTAGGVNTLPVTAPGGGAIPEDTRGWYIIQTGENAQFYQFAEWTGAAWQDIGAPLAVGADIVATAQAALAVSARAAAEAALAESTAIYDAFVLANSQPYLLAESWYDLMGLEDGSVVYWAHFGATIHKSNGVWYKRFGEPAFPSIANLVRYYDFEDDTALGRDLMETEDLVTYTDDVPMGQGDPLISSGNSALWDTSQNHVMQGPNPVVWGDQDMYLCGWVRRTAGAYYVTVRHTASQMIRIYRGSTNTLTFQMHNNAAENVVVTRAATDGTTFFFEAIYDSVNDLVKLCVNRGTETSAALAGGFNLTNQPRFRLGGQYSNAAGSTTGDQTPDFSGRMDQVMLFLGAIPTDHFRDYIWNNMAGSDIQRILEYEAP